MLPLNVTIVRKSMILITSMERRHQLASRILYTMSASNNLKEIGHDKPLLRKSYDKLLDLEQDFVSTQIWTKNKSTKQTPNFDYPRNELESIV
jgi:hypothetical protein